MEDDEGVVEPVREKKIRSALRDPAASKDRDSRSRNRYTHLISKPFEFFDFPPPNCPNCNMMALSQPWELFFSRKRNLLMTTECPFVMYRNRIMSSPSVKDRQEKTQIPLERKWFQSKKQDKERAKEAIMVSVPPVRVFIVAYSAFSQQVVLPAHVTSKQDRRGPMTPLVLHDQGSKYLPCTASTQDKSVVLQRSEPVEPVAVLAVFEPDDRL